MGYTTELSGAFKLDKPLKPEHATYLLQFSDTRRMRRDSKIADTLPDRIRIAAGLPIGLEGAYFVGGLGFGGQDDDASILAYNDPPQGQPGLWCQWVPNQNKQGSYFGDDAPEGTWICWNGAEKFYYYIEWLQYIIEHFLKPWGYVLNGEVEWAGEDKEDIGMIVVNNNVITKKLGAIVYKIEEEWASEAEKAAKKKAKAEALEQAKLNLANVKKITRKVEKIVSKPAKKIKQIKKAKKIPKKYLDSRNIKKAAKKASKKR